MFSPHRVRAVPPDRCCNSTQTHEGEQEDAGGKAEVSHPEELVEDEEGEEDELEDDVGLHGIPDALLPHPGRVEYARDDVADEDEGEEVGEGTVAAVA